MAQLVRRLVVGEVILLRYSGYAILAQECYSY